MRCITAARALAGATLLLCAAPAFADPSGSYSIDGTNPDGSTYAASVLVSRVGDTFTLTYTLDGDRKVTGTAIGDNDVLSIGYAENGQSGVALMYHDGDSWQGVWTYLGSKSMGTEKWQPN